MSAQTSGTSKPRLGRGLDALLPSAPPAQPAPAVPGVPGASANAHVPIEDLHPNRGQPRRHFDAAALEELAQSIREVGVLEPILVRNRKAGGYEIIAGERRWRAAQKAALREVPVFVRELSDKEAFEAALVENLQREDLNPIETARAFHRLVEEHGHTQESVAARIGKDRSTVANAMRLLKLPQPVLELVETGELSEGHGRAVLGAPDVDAMITLARFAAHKNLSVRETERRARELARGDQAKADEATGKTKSVNVLDLEKRLTHALGARVTVEERGGKGHLSVHYNDYDELDRVLEKLFR